MDPNRPQDSDTPGEPTRPTQPEGSYTPPSSYQPPQQDYPQQPTVPMGGPPPQYTPPPGSVPPPGYAQPSQYAPPPGQGYAMPPQPPKKGGMPVWGWVAIGVALFACIGCGAAAFILPRILADAASTAIVDPIRKLSVELETTGFYSLLQVRSYDLAQDELNSNLSGQYSEDELKSRWEALEGTGSVTVTNDDPQISGARATVKMNFKRSGSATKSVALTLEEQSDDTWEITEASPNLIPDP